MTSPIRVFNRSNEAKKNNVDSIQTFDTSNSTFDNAL